MIPATASRQRTGCFAHGRAYSNVGVWMLAAAPSSLKDLEVAGLGSFAGSSMWPLAVAVFAWPLASLLRRLRRKLSAQGLLPRLVGLAGLALRLLALTAVVAVLVDMFGLRSRPALPWVLLGVAAAFAWAARDLLPDIVAGSVVFFERRIRPGVWLSGDGYSGTVESLGLRAAWLRDGQGQRLSLPNRRLLEGPVVSRPATAQQARASVRVEGRPPNEIRKALTDAALMSPWVPPTSRPTVLRDSQEPSLWHLQCPVLDAAYAKRFEGEILERTEEILRLRPEDAEYDGA